MEYHCPNCKSENIQKVEIIYKSGTSNTSISTSAYIPGSWNHKTGFTSGRTVYGGGVSSSQTLLAKRFAPPSRRIPRVGLSLLMMVVIFCTIVWCGVLVYVTTQFGHHMDPRLNTMEIHQRVKKDIIQMIEWLIIPIVISIFCQKRIKVTQQWNLTVYPQLYDEWLKSWVCHKCGYVFQNDSE